jgi:hypothetical protein
MAEKKKEALAAVELMRATFARVRSDEEAKRGLVIIKAVYGRHTNVADVSRRGTDEEGGREAGTTADPEHLDEVIDVTIPLQCLVKDSKLILHEASKVCSSFERNISCVITENKAAGAQSTGYVRTYVSALLSYSEEGMKKCWLEET